MPKVSVILTSYNHAKYLRESIESVLNQTFSDFELIIGDDASTDESWAIIQSYTDPRIHTYRHEVNKMGCIINEIVSSGQASGDLIAIHHSDDIWEPQKLAKQVAFLDANPEVGALFTTVQIIDEAGNPFQDQNHFYSKRFEQANRTRYEWLNFFFFEGNALCHPSVLLRKECYATCGLYRYGLVQLGDWDMWVRICLKYEIHILPEKLTRFRILTREANSSGDRPDVHIRTQFEFLQIYANYLKITDRNEFLKVFPSASGFLDRPDFDIPFALAMVALATPNPFAKLFSLQLLFDRINHLEFAPKLERVYGFDQLAFSALTVEHDPFSVAALRTADLQIKTVVTQNAALAAQNAALATQVAGLSTRMAEKESVLNAILQSRSWKFIQILQRIRLKLVPTGSRQEQLLRLTWRGLRLLRSQGIRAFLREVIARVRRKISRGNRRPGIRGAASRKFNRDYQPVPRLSGAWRDKARLIEASGFFDHEWYLSDNPEVVDERFDPVEHYLIRGIPDERNPNPLFNTSIYASHFGLHKADALLHFAESGRLFAPGAYRSAEVLMSAQQKYQRGLVMEPLKDSRVQPKKYAVYFQCGAGSIHKEWMTNSKRDWDLLVNHYDPTHVNKISCEVEFRQVGSQPGTKFTSFNQLLTNWPDMLKPYQYVLLLDDDIFMKEEDINRLFAIAEAQDLDLAQASLSADSYSAHPILKNPGKGGLRQSSGVEIMMPIISQAVLQRAGYLFNHTISGWGIDFVIGRYADRIAIIDDVIARHSKPINVEGGAFYRMLHAAYIYPEIELTHFQRIYNVGRSFQVTAFS